MFDDVELKGNFCYGVEIEGGHNYEINELEKERIGLNQGWDGATENFIYNSIELKTQGYWQEDCIEKCKQLVDLLNDKEWGANETCGIHVHMSNENSNPFNINFIVRLLRFYLKIEDVIYAFLPDNRKEGFSEMLNLGLNNDFVKIITEMSYKALDNLENKEFFKSWYGCDSGVDGRYYGINLSTYFYRGTLEFRMFNSDHMALINYIDFLDKLMSVVKNNNVYQLDKYARRINDAEGINRLNKLCKILNVAESTKEKLLEQYEIYEEDESELIEEPTEEELTVGELVGDIFAEPATTV